MPPSSSSSEHAVSGVGGTDVGLLESLPLLLLLLTAEKVSMGLEVPIRLYRESNGLDKWFEQGEMAGPSARCWLSKYGTVPPPARPSNRAVAETAHRSVGKHQFAPAPPDLPRADVRQLGGVWRGRRCGRSCCVMGDDSGNRPPLVLVVRSGCGNDVGNGRVLM
jgi:hypothetical protein